MACIPASRLSVSLALRILDADYDRGQGRGNQLQGCAGRRYAGRQSGILHDPARDFTEDFTSFYRRIRLMHPLCRFLENFEPLPLQVIILF
jgi:hypothetical protein